jgi:hypothetical protein
LSFPRWPRRPTLIGQACNSASSFASGSSSLLGAKAFCGAADCGRNQDVRIADTCRAARPYVAAAPCSNRSHASQDRVKNQLPT